MNINVSKPHLPSIDDYTKYLNGIWNRNWLTNNGPLVHELERAISDFLDLDYVLLTTNGTVALQIAIRALELSGEVITTPFSYVATTSSLVWENCKPVMVDIERDTLMINPGLIEESITSRTSAILATHVFGEVCDVSSIQSIANKYGLKVIYDGAHCFGTSINGRSAFNFGDISTASFHATKLFHTVEGGAVFAKNAKLHEKMSLLRNFGHTGVTTRKCWICPTFENVW